MPIVRRAVLGAVLAHRRHRNAIGEGDAAEAEWFEQETPSFHQIDPTIAIIGACRFDRASQWRTTEQLSSLPNPRSSSTKGSFGIAGPLPWFRPRSSPKNRR